jgi:Tol biopolymer transport system component
LSGRETGGDIGLLSLDGDRKLMPLIQTPFDEGQGAFSHDGRSVAYTSNESGRSEVYVQPYPAMDARVQVSTDGGNEPVWSHSGRELFFRQGKKLMAADVMAAPRFSAGRPRVLFEGDFAGGPGTPGTTSPPTINDSSSCAAAEALARTSWPSS